MEGQPTLTRQLSLCSGVEAAVLPGLFFGYAPPKLQSVVHRGRHAVGAFVVEQRRSAQADSQAGWAWFCRLVRFVAGVCVWGFLAGAGTILERLSLSFWVGYTDSASCFLLVPELRRMHLHTSCASPQHVCVCV